MSHPVPMYFCQTSEAYQPTQSAFFLHNGPQQMVNINCVLVVTTVAHLLTFVWIIAEQTENCCIHLIILISICSCCWRYKHTTASNKCLNKQEVFRCGCNENFRNSLIVVNLSRTLLHIYKYTMSHYFNILSQNRYLLNAT